MSVCDVADGEATELHKVYQIFTNISQILNISLLLQNL